MTRRRDPPGVDYRHLFDALPVPMLILSTDLIMLDMNEAYLAVSGASRDDLVGRTPMEVFPDNPDDPKATGVRNLTRSLHAVLDTGHPDTMALQRYDVQAGPGGAFEERYWSPVNIPVHDREGRITHVIHRVEEVTEFVRLRGTTDPATAEHRSDAELRTKIGRLEADLIARAGEVQEANQRLREVNAELSQATRSLREQQQAKDRFIATLSHELRNPLAAIRAAIDLLTLDSPAGHPAIDVLDRQVTALVRMTNDLLDSSRALTGRLTLARQPLDLREVVGAVTGDLRPGFDQTRRHLIVALPEDPVPVDGDRVRLAQLLGNLLSNAFAYTRPGATITVRLASQPGTSSGDPGYAILAVRDDGIGFDPDQSEALFEVFARATAGTEAEGFGKGGTPSGGLGLGLGLVRSIAELHGGTASAHSEGPGKGAEFMTSLPLRGPMGPAAGQPGPHHVQPFTPGPGQPTASPGQPAGSLAHPPARLQPPGERAPLRILIIEDNADLAASYTELLGRRGDRVTVAHTAGEGLSIARARHFDVVLCDIGLPDGDGRDIARRLRSHPRRGRMRLVAVSGFSQEADRQRSLAAGFDAHLAKPITLADIDDVLSRWPPP